MCVYEASPLLVLFCKIMYHKPASCCIFQGPYFGNQPSIMSLHSFYRPERLANASLESPRPSRLPLGKVLDVRDKLFHGLHAHGII